MCHGGGVELAPFPFAFLILILILIFDTGIGYSSLEYNVVFVFIDVPVYYCNHFLSLPAFCPRATEL